MPIARALASPASVKGVLSAGAAAAALAEGLRSWAEVDELPVADGGEGTLDVLHVHSEAIGTRSKCRTPSGSRASRAGFSPLTARRWWRPRRRSRSIPDGSIPSQPR